MKKSFIYFMRLFIFPYIRRHTVRVEGADNFPKEGNYIIASNHENSWDHFFISHILNDKLERVSFVGAMDSPKVIFYSLILYYFSDTIAIDRRKANREKFLEKVGTALSSGKIIILYPEGDITKGGSTLLRGKTGAADLALKTSVPVIPIGMQNDVKSKKRIIRIGKPLYFPEESALAIKSEPNEERHNLLRNITDNIMKEISVLCGKKYLG